MEPKDRNDIANGWRFPVASAARSAPVASGNQADTSAVVRLSVVASR